MRFGDRLRPGARRDGRGGCSRCGRDARRADRAAGNSHERQLDPPQRTPLRDRRPGRRGAGGCEPSAEFGQIGGRLNWSMQHLLLISENRRCRSQAARSRSVPRPFPVPAPSSGSSRTRGRSPARARLRHRANAPASGARPDAGAPAGAAPAPRVRREMAIVVSLDRVRHLGQGETRARRLPHQSNVAGVGVPACRIGQDA
jgi:hypothetical protein